MYFDDAVYALIGKSIAIGEGLRYLNLPGHPSAVHYPPGYPLLLAWLWRAFGAITPVQEWAQRLNAACLAACAAMTCEVLRRSFGVNRWVAALAGAMGVLALPLIGVATLLFSEPLFLTLTLGSLILAERSVRTASARDSAVAAAALGAGALVRSIGIIAIPAMIAVLLLHRRWRQVAASGIAAAATVGPWLVWVVAHHPKNLGLLEGTYGSYSGYVLDAVRELGSRFIVSEVVKNLREMVELAGALFSPLKIPGLEVPVAACVVGGAAVGLWASWRRAPISVVFLVLYFTVVAVWPYEPMRFLAGIWPLVIGALVVAGAVAVGVLRRRRSVPAWAVLSAVVVVLGGNMRRTMHSLVIRGWELSQLAPAEQMAPVIRWIQAHPAITGTVATPYEPMVSLYTGRTTVPTNLWNAAYYLDPRNPTRDNSNLRQVLLEFRPALVVVPAPGEISARRVQALLAPLPVRTTPIEGVPGSLAILTLDWSPIS